jgi:hypothetical protein
VPTACGTGLGAMGWKAIAGFNFNNSAMANTVGDSAIGVCRRSKYCVSVSIIGLLCIAISGQG